jgi:hypothetical protein
MLQQGEGADWRRLMEDPKAGSHSVQFYKDPRFLMDVVGSYLEAGVARGEGAVAVMTPEHRAMLLDRLASRGLDPLMLQERHGIVLLDAQKMLSAFMDGDTVNAEVMFALVDEAVDAARRSRGERVRAFGEMVDVLWREERQESALALEDVWCRYLEGRAIALHCAYDADIFDPATYLGNLQCVHHKHTHVIVADEPEALDAAVEQAMLDVFGPLGSLLLRPSLAGDSADTTRLLQELAVKIPAAAESVLSRARIQYCSSRAYSA